MVLDEPNSNLDAEGERALTQAILGVRARGGVVVVIAHRPSALAGVDLVLVMADGKAQSFGPKDEVLNKVSGATPRQSAMLKIVETRWSCVMTIDSQAERSPVDPPAHGDRPRPRLFFSSAAWVAGPS